MHYLSLQQGFGKVLRMTQHMLALAKLEDWYAVTTLEAERQRAIDALFGHPEITRTLADFADTLQQIIDIDKECIALGLLTRRNLAQALDKTTQGERAIQAYINSR